MIGDNPGTLSTDNALQFQVEQKMARGIEDNYEKSRKAIQKVAPPLGGTGYFRTAMKRDKWEDDTRARWSGQVHETTEAGYANEGGAYIKDAEGSYSTPSW